MSDRAAGADTVSARALLGRQIDCLFFLSSRLQMAVRDCGFLDKDVEQKPKLKHPPHAKAAGGKSSSKADPDMMGWQERVKLRPVVTPSHKNLPVAPLPAKTLDHIKPKPKSVSYSQSVVRQGDEIPIRANAM